MSRPSVRVHRPNGIEGVEKIIALRAAEAYCRDNGLSVSKLSRQIYDVFDDVAIFAAPTGVEPDGLRNDMATQPVPVLVLRGQGDNLVISQTEHTAKYLSN